MSISRQIKVGIFVLLGLVVSGIVVFLIGDERRLFSRSVELDATFNDVQGMKVGAPVRMNGIDVGTVLWVGHSNDLGDSLIHVHMRVVRSEALRLHADAEAKVVNKGLLGDKMMELAPGKTGPMPESTIRGIDPTDFSNVMNQVGPIAEKARSVLANLDLFSASLADDALRTDLKGGTHSLSIILNEIASGNGYAHRLLADPSEADHMSHAIENIEKTSAELAQAATQLRAALDRVNQGPGFVHDLVYSKEGTETVTQLGKAAGEVASTLAGVRTSKGIAHEVMYGDGEPQQVITHLNDASRDLRDILANVKAGKGTLGALLVDPSVYEDLKIVLGNVQRNEVLRALVRYSIKQDQTRPTVQVKDPEQAPAKQ